MNLISIILYGTGVVGVIIALILTFMSISKTQISFVLIGSTFVLSLLLIGSGTFFILHSIKSNTSDKADLAINNTDLGNENKKTASIDDLKFKCELPVATNASQKKASITIENRSDSVFNGKINLNFTDSSNNTTDSLEIPINNLMPKSSYSPKILVSGSASNSNYSFSGIFDSIKKNNVPYTVKKIFIGNNSYRFDISVKDTSHSNLQNISNEFMSKYTSNICNSFLIYFYPSDKGDNSNLNEAIGDFYYDYSSNTSKLTIYN
ncbi:MAG: hypothetical protein E7207_01705 [Clostridium butyricum]|nr:hypothetical protein [Clostridium butyricum]